MRKKTFVEFANLRKENLREFLKLCNANDNREIFFLEVTLVSKIFQLFKLSKFKIKKLSKCNDYTYR